MKKQQKIIELRTAAKSKIAELKTKIAFSRSDHASKRARLMWSRAAELDGLEAGSTERFDVLAKYRAKLAGVNEQLAATVAQLKFEIQQTKAECEKQCAAAEDDPETMRELPQQTVYCDGSEHSARIVARRLINKMPHIKRGYLQTSVAAFTFSGNTNYFVSVWCGDGDRCFNTNFSKENHTFELEADFIEKARNFFNTDEESGNSHVAEPIAHALDAFFGGNPVEQVDNLIADTVKIGKEGENE